MFRYALAMIVAAAATAQAGTPASAPAARPKTPQTAPAAKTSAAGEALKVTVVSVSGPAQKLVTTDGKNTWQPLAAQEELGEMTVIRTGFGAKVVLKFEDRGTVVVDSATKIGLGELRKQGTSSKERLGLKYGTVRATVEAGKGKNDFQVATPVATLSVRGSWADISFQVDSPWLIDAGSGRWEVEKAHAGRSTTVHGGEMTNVSLTPWNQLLLDQRTPHMEDPYGSTGPEQASMTSNPHGRRTVNLPSGSGSTMPVTTCLPGIIPAPQGEPGYP